MIMKKTDSTKDLFTDPLNNLLTGCKVILLAVAVNLNKSSSVTR